MNILVCVKQVPGSSNVEVDPVTGVLKRDGVQSKMNPYDLYGIELRESKLTFNLFFGRFRVAGHRQPRGDSRNKRF